MLSALITATVTARRTVLHKDSHQTVWIQTLWLWPGLVCVPDDEPLTTDMAPTSGPSLLSLLWSGPSSTTSRGTFACLGHVIRRPGQSLTVSSQGRTVRVFFFFLFAIVLHSMECSSYEVNLLTNYGRNWVISVFYFHKCAMDISVLNALKLLLCHGLKLPSFV